MDSLLLRLEDTPKLWLAYMWRLTGLSRLASRMERDTVRSTVGVEEWVGANGG